MRMMVIINVIVISILIKILVFLGRLEVIGLLVVGYLYIDGFENYFYL